ncbi:MAG: hypothetical protein P8Y58_01295 [Novosphingobium sp.]
MAQQIIDTRTDRHRHFQIRVRRKSLGPGQPADSETNRGGITHFIGIEQAHVVCPACQVEIVKRLQIERITQQNAVDYSRVRHLAQSPDRNTLAAGISASGCITVARTATTRHLNFALARQPKLYKRIGTSKAGFDAGQHSRSPATLGRRQIAPGFFGRPSGIEPSGRQQAADNKRGYDGNQLRNPGDE